MMRFLFDEHSGDPYDLGHIERKLSDLNNASQALFFDRYIRGIERLPIAHFLPQPGIDTKNQDGRTVFQVRDDSEKGYSQIRQGLFN